MKRRDFLKSVLGVSAVASVAIYAKGMMGGMMGGGSGMMGNRGEAMGGSFGGELKDLSSFFNPLKIPQQLHGTLKGGVLH